MSFRSAFFSGCAMLCLLSGCALFAAERPASDPETDALFKRLYPNVKNPFVFIQETKSAPDAADSFVIESGGDWIVIRGNSQSALNAGLGYYLNHFAEKQHVSDCGRTLTPPKTWPKLTQRIEKSAPGKIRGMYNYCTYGYTFDYWDFPEWEKELDRIALMGVNQALLLPGHEKVWQNTMRRLKASEADIAAFLPTQPYTGWWLMANLEGTGGPISANEVEREAELGRKMAGRMKDLGIDPIVNGFVGAVPSTLKKTVPGHYIPQGKWGGVPRPDVLSPLDPAFETVGRVYYDELKKQFGEVRYFGGDLFHEGGNKGGLKLGDCGEAIQKLMCSVEPDAVWVLQGWGGNPDGNLLKKLDPEHTLVQQLTLDCANFQKGKLRKFGKIPWTLSVVNNFGGNHGLYGNLRNQAALPAWIFGQEYGNFHGFALLDEGMERNPVSTALYGEVFWSRTPVDLDAFLRDYTKSRYGVAAPEIFTLLLDDVYAVPSAQEGVCDFIIPGVAKHGNDNKARFWCKNVDYWNTDKIFKATEMLLALKANTEGYRYDCVDFVRQCANRYTWELYKQKNGARPWSEMPAEIEKIIRTIEELDALCALSDYFTLDRLFDIIERNGRTPEEVTVAKRAVCTLFTYWNYARVGHLDAYASRSFSPMLKDYYAANWRKVMTQYAAQPNAEQKTFHNLRKKIGAEAEIDGLIKAVDARRGNRPYNGVTTDEVRIKAKALFDEMVSGMKTVKTK